MYDEGGERQEDTKNKIEEAEVSVSITDIEMQEKRRKIRCGMQGNNNCACVT